MRITFLKNNTTFEIEANEKLSIAKNAVLNGISFSKHPTCKGQGSCEHCKMRIDDETLVLGCQVYPKEGMRITIIE